MHAPEETLDKVDEKIDQLETQILDPQTPPDKTERLRWTRFALCAVRDYVSGKSEEIKL